MTPKQVYARVQAHCLAKEGAVEEYPWGDVVWKVGGKMFAATGEGSNVVTVKASPDEQAVLVQHPAIEIAKYVGRFGWVTITITDAETLRLALHLIDGSYESLRPKSAKKPTEKPAKKAVGKLASRTATPRR